MWRSDPILAKFVTFEIAEWLLLRHHVALAVTCRHVLISSTVWIYVCLKGMNVTMPLLLESASKYTS